MASTTKKYIKSINTSILILLAALLLGGCADMGLGLSQSNEEMESSTPPTEEAPPYYANEFEDLLIPKELSWNREKSMVIRTESFAGGILNFSGNVDITSLTDFFTHTMVKSGWKMAGSAKYKNVLLAFIKPYKTCTITIKDNGFGLKTELYVYITEDITKGGSSLDQSMSFDQ
jgi:hypothetical protein